MLKEKIAKGPNTVHPERPSAVGSRNSLNRDNRNEYQEAGEIVDEEIDKILNHVTAKLPPEVLDKLDVMGGVKDKIHNYFNQNLQNMTNRYMTTVEDELLKKYRDLVDREEFKQLNRYTPPSISEIMSKIGGEDQFNTSGIEKSIANIYEHLQGHLQRGIHEFEHNTTTLLRQKNDVGSFIRRENAYAIVKCSFKNNSIKPKVVSDVKLAINILDSELIAPIFHYQKPLEHLLKEIISKHIHHLIDQNVGKINADRMNSGQEELSGDDQFMEKLKSLENYLSFSDDPTDEKSKRYDFIAKRFLDSLESDDFEIPSKELETQNIRENVTMILDKENVHNRGFNRVVNVLTTILDNTKMGYQYIENFKNARVCLIREYALKNAEELPDETFSLRLSYYDNDQLIEHRKAYDLQFKELANEIEKAGLVVDRVHFEYRKKNDIKSYYAISKQILEKSEKQTSQGWWEKRKKESEEDPEMEDTMWSELTFLTSNANGTDATTNMEKSKMLKMRIGLMKEQIREIYGSQHPEERIILDERVEFLEHGYQSFAATINPHHIQQGLVLEVDITSLKRKRTTLHAMSNVLNEFLFQVSQGFSDQTVPIHVRTGISEGEAVAQKFSSVLQDMDKSLEEVEA